MTRTDAAMMILRQQVTEKRQGQVARELDISKAALSQILSGKYKADTARMEAKVLAIYGHGGQVPCPVLGETTPSECANNHERARRVGLKGGNPNTLRLLQTCLNCPVRKG